MEFLGIYASIIGFAGITASSILSIPLRHLSYIGRGPAESKAGREEIVRAAKRELPFFFAAAVAFITPFFVLDSLIPSFVFVIGVAAAIASVYLAFRIACLLIGGISVLPGGDYRGGAWGLARYAGSAAGLLPPGLVLTVAGLLFQFSAVDNSAAMGSFSVGGALVLFFCVIAAGRSERMRGKSTPALLATAVSLANTDLLVSFILSFTSAMIAGSVTGGGYAEWQELPVLFVVAGYLASLAGIAVILFSKEKAHWSRWISAGIFIAVAFLLVRKNMAVFSSDDLAEAGMLDRSGPFWAVSLGAVIPLLTGLLIDYYSSPERVGKAEYLFSRAEGVILPAVFTATAIWMSHIFAGLYGVALAALGISGTLSVSAALNIAGRFFRKPGSGGGQGESYLRGMIHSRRSPDPGRGYVLTSSIFAASAGCAAYAATLKEGFRGSPDILPGMAGLILGMAAAYLMFSSFLKTGPSWKRIYLPFIMILLILFAAGFLAGPGITIGFLAGTVLAGAATGFLVWHAGSKEAGVRQPGNEPNLFEKHAADMFSGLFPGVLIKLIVSVALAAVAIAKF
ncbi:MAG: hypothetical protein ACE14T_04025 [Syntrophales bacterium]